MGAGNCLRLEVAAGLGDAHFNPLSLYLRAEVAFFRRGCDGNLMLLAVAPIGLRQTQNGREILSCPS
jgi:hypothetical protein